MKKTVLSVLVFSLLCATIALGSACNPANTNDGIDPIVGSYYQQTSTDVSMIIVNANGTFKRTSASCTRIDNGQAYGKWIETTDDGTWTLQLNGKYSFKWGEPVKTTTVAYDNSQSPTTLTYGTIKHTFDPNAATTYAAMKENNLANLQSAPIVGKTFARIDLNLEYHTLYEFYDDYTYRWYIFTPHRLVSKTFSWDRKGEFAYRLYGDGREKDDEDLDASYVDRVDITPRFSAPFTYYLISQTIDEYILDNGLPTP